MVNRGDRTGLHALGGPALHPRTSREVGKRLWKAGGCCQGPGFAPEMARTGREADLCCLPPSYAPGLGRRLPPGSWLCSGPCIPLGTALTMHRYNPHCRWLSVSQSPMSRSVLAPININHRMNLVQYLKWSKFFPSIDLTALYKGR